MQELFKQAESIAHKVKQLKSKLAMLEREIAFYKEENKNLVEKHKQQQGLIKELESQANHKKSSTPEKLSEKERATIQKKIKAHVDEIDEVIELLRK